MSLVSIVLPCYNGEKYLAQSIESVINQTYTEWELIIVNDCSTDSTKHIAEQYAAQNAKITVIDNATNCKLPKSLNIGFQHTKGDFLSWTSDDNFFHNTAVEKMVFFLQKNAECAIVCCDFNKINANNELLVTHHVNVTPIRLLRGNEIGACFLYRKTAADLVGSYDEKKFLVEDYDYWLRIGLVGKIGQINETLYTYRSHSTSLTTTRLNDITQFTKREQKEFLPKYLKKYPALKREPDIISLKKEVSIKTTIINSIKKNIRASLPYKALRKLSKMIILGKHSGNIKNIQQITQDIAHIELYNKAQAWIKKYTVNNNGIAVNSIQPNTIYPEVTGYYIPTLLNFGNKKLAIQFANYLVSIQNADGSWNDPSGKVPYTFDTGMILKGLFALITNDLDINGEYKKAFIKGCDWITTQQRNDGSLATPDPTSWVLPNNNKVPEYVHIYCLEPLLLAAKIFGIKKYEDCVKKALSFYLKQHDLTSFNTLSHFHAYIVEGLIDIGELNAAKKAMNNIAQLQNNSGFIPAYKNSSFTCSTGLFQYAICWYKLGEIEKADKTFLYACKLQNEGGGWFGSYGKGANYFENAEIAWAVKYFLDAITYGQKANYKKIAHTFLDEIDDTDERYKTIENELKPSKYIKILDLGCGKGRYTKKLIKKYPEKKFYCVDISAKVMEYIVADVEKKEGSILNIPYKDENFDFVFIAEALKHAIDIEHAIEEIYRVIKKDGELVIIDKDKKHLGQLQLAKFEQWFDEKELSLILCKNGFDVTVNSNLQYENQKTGLFNSWIGVKR